MVLMIQWKTAIHPAEGMAELSCRLQSLTLYHPQAEWLLAQLNSIQAAGLVEVQALAPTAIPYLEAKLMTPLGEKILRSSM